MRCHRFPARAWRSRGRRGREPSDARVLGLVLRGLGVVYVIAFSSLRRQVPGLYGRRGIVPLQAALQALRQEGGRWSRWYALPTLLWSNADDVRMVRLCAAGQVAGLALATGVFPRAAAVSALALYLSFVSVGAPFLSYQWDALLVEAGWLGALAGPSGRRLRWSRRDPPPRLWLMLLRLLVFRLHFESGWAKLHSGDRSWRDGSACAYHYETQPLPTPLALRAHRQPRWFHDAATRLVILLETVVPFLAFGPRRARRAAFIALEALQVAIAATGNFAFFNLLSVVLTWSLLGERRPGRLPPPRGHSSWVRALEETAADLDGALQLLDVMRRVRPRRAIAGTLAAIEDRAAPLRPVSSYGLFSVMTRERLEIIIEGSSDGRTWLPYEFPHKPGDLRRPPRWIAPWQPRLDWQMWFAALSPVPPSWFPTLLRRLLEGEPGVLALFERNPFPDHPPRMVRALLYRYRLTDAATHRATGATWNRELLGQYFPPVGLARG